MNHFMARLIFCFFAEDTDIFHGEDLFTRTFELVPGGTLLWTGDPIDARLDLAATYRTRASLAGLGLPEAQERQRVPVVVRADVSGRVLAPLIRLSLAVDRQGEGGPGLFAMIKAAGEGWDGAEPLRRL